MEVTASGGPAGFTTRRDLTWLAYGAAAGMNIFAIFGAWPAFGQPLFGYVALFLTLAGVPTSLWLRREGVRRQTVSLVVLAAALATAGAVLSRAELPGLSWERLLRYLLIMQESAAASYLIQAFLWVAMFRAFVLLEDEDLPLCAVPAMSAMLLASIILRTVSTFLCFLGVVACTVVVLALNERRLRAARARLAALSRGMEAETLRRVLLLLLAAVLGAAPLGYAMANFRYVHDLASALDARFGRYVRNRVLESAYSSIIFPGANVDLSSQAATGRRLLFRVQADADLFWRGNCFDTYTGYGWLHSGASRKRSLLETASPGRYSRRVQDLPPGVQMRQVNQTYEALTYFQGSLVAVYDPLELGGGFLKPRYNDEGVLTTSGYLRRGDTYQVNSMVKSPPPPVLQDTTYRLSQADQARYLALPEIPERLSRLSRQLTAGTADPRRKAQAILDYLQENLTYSKEVERPPRDWDGVDWFVFESKQGYCDYFATAMTVMCRAAGVPARFVTGYVTGSITADNWFEVRQEDAHAVVEVWVDGYGWLQMDPTPAQVEPPGVLQAAGARLSALWASARQQAADWLAMLASPAFHGRLLATGLVAALLAALVYWLRLEKAPAVPRNGGEAEARRYVVSSYNAMVGWLARWGVVKQAGATAAEFLAAARPVLAEAAGPAAAVVGHYQAARYGVGALPEATVTETAAAMRALLRHKRLIRKTLKSYSP